MVTYRIYSNGEIEKHIPKVIKSGYESKYDYIYHDASGKEHDVCIADWHTTREKNNGTKPGIKPSHNWILTDDNVSDGQTTRRVKYANGDIAEYGSNEGKSFWVLYTVTGSNIELVKMPDSLNYNSSGVVIKYAFTNTKRRYTDPGHLIYLDDTREQKLIDAFHKFGITKQLRGSNKKAFNHTSDGKKLHNSHLHSGIIASGKIKIIKEQ